MFVPQDCSTPLGDRFDNIFIEKMREISKRQEDLEKQRLAPFLTERELGATIEHREAIIEHREATIRDLKKTLTQKYAEITEKDAKITKLKNSKRKLKRQLKKAKKQAIPARPNVR